MTEEIEDKLISIVIHGGFFENNSSDVLNILINYREIFKKSEIIFSISSSDFIDFSKSTESEVIAYKKNMENACRIVNEYADKIAYSYIAQPLPPVFRDGPNSHPNHLIESAKNGLALATRQFVLRVRNDLLFKNRDFIEKYIELKEKYYKEGKYTIFSSPIMISSLYTLNPYAEARLPFHFSDWFHFGKLSDIRPIWDIPLITLDFITYYTTNHYRPGSLEKERNFFSRLAIEQYIYFTFFSYHFKEIKLDYHNDDRSTYESLQILLDNFIVVDVYNLNVFYPKYGNGFNPYTNNNTKIMQESWEYLVSHREINPSKLLHVARKNTRDYTPVIFPFRIEVDHLYTKTGFSFGKSLFVSPDAPPGVACFGPHMLLNKGHYTARVAVSSLYPVNNNCKIKVAATGHEGSIVLGFKNFHFNKVNGYTDQYTYLEISFNNPYDRLEKFEIVVSTEDQIDLAIDYIDILKS